MTDLEFISIISQLTNRELKEYPIYGLFDSSESKFIHRNSFSLNENGKVIALSISDVLNKGFVYLDYIKEFKLLEKLQVFHSEINDLSFLNKSLPLNYLDLELNNIKDISPIANFENLIHLILSQNEIVNISPLKGLKNLTLLDLQFNKIENLPSWICDYEKMEIQWFSKNETKNGFITFAHNPIKPDLITILELGKDTLRGYMQGLSYRSIKNTFIKLIFVGNARVGKSTLIEMLTTGKCENKKESTHGLEISERFWQPADSDLNVNIYDFGGQDYYHATHKLFFTDNSLYILVWTKEKNKNGISSEEIPIYQDGDIVIKEISLNFFSNIYWLQSIRHYYNDPSTCPIMMVQTKVIKETYEEKDPNCSKLFGVDLEDFHFDTLNASAFKQKPQLKELKKDFTNYESFFESLTTKLTASISPKEIPVSWDLARQNIINFDKNEQNIINWSDYKSLCGINDENELNALTKYLCNSGFILYFPENNQLSKKVFINPRLIKDTIYKILDFKIKSSKGKFTRQHVKDLLRNSSEESKDYEFFIELMKADQFDLIFQVPNEPDTFIAPQYLDEIEENVVILQKNPLNFAFAFKIPSFFSQNILLKLLSHYGKFSIPLMYGKNALIMKLGRITICIHLINDDKNYSIIEVFSQLKPHPKLREIYDFILSLAVKTDDMWFAEEKDLFAQFNEWKFNHGYDFFYSEKKIINKDFFYYLNYLSINKIQPYSKAGIKNKFKKAVAS